MRPRGGLERRSRGQGRPAGPHDGPAGMPAGPSVSLTLRRALSPLLSLSVYIYCGKLLSKITLVPKQCKCVLAMLPGGAGVVVLEQLPVDGIAATAPSTFLQD